MSGRRNGEDETDSDISSSPGLRPPRVMVWYPSATTKALRIHSLGAVGLGILDSTAAGRGADIQLQAFDEYRADRLFSNTCKVPF